MLDSLKKVFANPERKSVEVELEEFEDWLEEHSEDMREKLEKDVNRRVEDIEDTISDLNKGLDKLEEKNVPEDAGSRLKKIGETNKEVLVERLNSFVEEFSLPNDTHPNKVLNTIEDIEDELDELSDNLQRNIMIVQKAYKDIDVLKYLKKLDNGMEDIKESISDNNYYNIKNDLDNLLSDINSLIERKENLIEEQERIEDEIEQSKHRKEKLREKLDELEGSVSSGKREEIDEKIENLEREISKIENKVRNSVSPLERALKKFQYMGSVPENIDIDKYINSPLEVLKSEGTDGLKDLKEELSESLENGNLGFDDNERSKTEKNLGDLSIGKIESRLERLEDLQEKLDGARDKKDDISIESEKKRIQSDMEDIERSIREMTEEVDNLTRKARETSTEIQEKKDKLEDKTGKLLNVDLNID